MEKLQAALHKARQHRNAERPLSSPAPQQQAPTQDASGAEGEVSLTARRRRTSHQTTQSIAWEHLPLHTLDIRKARQNRLSAIASGRDAGPHDMLRTRIMHMARVKNWHRIALISPHQGCGKTVTAANLAFSFGRQHDRRTMVFDLDLRSIGLSKMLGIKRTCGMADVLSKHLGFHDHAVRIRENVVLGLNRAPVQNPSEILQSQNTQSVLDQIEQDFQPDIMLFDMPSLMATDEAIGFLKNVDCAILIAEIGRTTIKQIDKAERQISELTNVMGVVLNKAPPFEATYGYD